MAVREGGCKQALHKSHMWTVHALRWQYLSICCESSWPKLKSERRSKPWGNVIYRNLENVAVVNRVVTDIRKC